MSWKELNRIGHISKLTQEAEISSKQHIASLKLLEIEDNKKKEEENHLWLDNQKLSRAESRRISLEQMQHEQCLEEQKKQRMKHIQKMEEARIQEVMKKRGKKGKKSTVRK